MSVSSVQGLPADRNITGTPTPPSNQLDSSAFMKLLMTQIANQDPLNPVDSDRFMDQIAQLNTVQQLTEGNEKLGQLIVGMTSLNNENAVQLVGKEVEAVGDRIQHDEGSAEELRFQVPQGAEDVTVTVLDEGGRVVATVEAHDLEAGAHGVSWDGRDNRGNPAVAGTYTFRVSATDSSGSPVTATTLVRGIVDEISFEAGYPVLKIGAQQVTLDQILSVRTPAAENQAASALLAATSSDPSLNPASLNLARFLRAIPR